MLKETWTRTNDINISPDEIKKDLVREVCLPNFQFKNPFELYDDILGYSVRRKLIIDDNYNQTAPSDYQTKITINADFSIPEQVPPKTQLTSSERLKKFLIKQGFKNF
ncbi:MAG: hypothetical protein AABW67_00350 [Nanoarchaeota archaeon]